MCLFTISIIPYQPNFTFTSTEI